MVKVTSKKPNETKARKMVRYISLGIGAFLSIYLIQNAYGFYRSGDRIDKAKSELKELESENRELESKLSEVRSREYIEKESREKLGLQYEGEVVVVLPDEEVLRLLAPQDKGEIKEELPKSNWQKWLNLFF